MASTSIPGTPELKIPSLTCVLEELTVSHMSVIHSSTSDEIYIRVACFCISRTANSRDQFCKTNQCNVVNYVWVWGWGV
jgi:hypothetical protein